MYSTAMGFLYQHDGQRLRPEFTCPCGSKRAERVTVKRPDGSIYETEFAKCFMPSKRASVGSSRGVDRAATSIAGTVCLSGGNLAMKCSLLIGDDDSCRRTIEGFRSAPAH